MSDQKGDDHSDFAPAKQYVFDETVESWVDMFELTNAGRPGDVLMFFTDRTFNQNAIENWAETALALHDQTRTQLYQTACLILPPLPNLFLQDPNKWKRRIPLLKYNPLSTLEKGELEAAILDQPSGTAIFIPSIELFRTEIKETQSLTFAKGWTGTTYRMKAIESVHEHHLFQTVESVIKIAKQKKILITAACGLPGSAAIKLNKNLNNPNSLLFLSEAPSQAQEITQELITTHQKLENGLIGLKSALKEIETLVSDPCSCALAKGQILFSKGCFETAWEEVAPHVGSITNASSKIYLNLGQSAVAAYRTVEALELLGKAIEAGLRSFEDYKNAYRLSEDLNEETQKLRILKEMENRFPSEVSVKQLSYMNSLHERDFVKAEELANSLHLNFEAQMWRSFQEQTLDLDKLEEHATEIGEIERFSAAVAMEYEERGELDLATSYAKRVSPDSRHAPSSVCVRIRALGSGLLCAGDPEEEDIKELMSILEFVALNPSAKDCRIALESVFSDTLNESDALTTLASTLWFALPSEFSQLPRLTNPSTPSDSDVESLLDFMGKLYASFDENLVVLGAGELPEGLKHLASFRLISTLSSAISESSDLTDYRSILLPQIKAIELLCTEVGDPTSDLLSGRIIAQKLVASANMQDARDLAEELLRALPNTQPMHNRYRHGVAWIVYSEVFSRCGNKLDALLYLCLGISLVRDQRLDQETYCFALRLCTIICRDLGLIPIALKTIEDEYKLRDSLGQTEALRQLEQLKLSIQLKEVHSDGDLLEVFNESMQQLEELPEGSEILPVASIVVSIFRLLRNRNLFDAEEIETRLSSVLKGDNSFSAHVLRHMISGQISHPELSSLVEKVGFATCLDDFASQFSQLHIISKDAVGYATARNDLSLFLSAASLQCQPALSIRATGHDVGSDGDLGKRDWLLSELSNSPSRERVSDFIRMAQRISLPKGYALSDVCRTSVEDLKSILDTGEAAIILAEDGSESLCTLVIGIDDEEGVRRLSHGEWSPSNYSGWSNKLRNGYDRASSRSGEGWEVTEIFESLNNLGIGLTKYPDKIVVIPHAGLFSFPFSLIRAESSFLGLRTTVSVAPSAFWLAQTRRTVSSPAFRKSAWLGSARSRNYEITYGHRSLKPLLQDHGFEVSETDNPDGLEDSHISILYLHGTKSGVRHFRSVSDGLESFPPEEIADAVRGSRCVVLLVCHGAHSEVPSNTNETEGLVTAILGAGVRSVVASSWPLTLETVEYWLRKFLSCCGNSLSISEAAQAASKEVELHVTDMAAWASLCVYGDGNTLV